MFICGGAFDGLEQLIKRRIGKKVIGFNTAGDGQKDLKARRILVDGLPEDLLKFGLIPEFVGRLPVISTLEPLDEAALVRILSEPKNALVKQYQKLLEMDNVKLEFEAAALDAIAKEAIKRNTGARGLRAIIEGMMLDVMYEVPSRDDVSNCLITEKVVQERSMPELTPKERQEERRKRVTDTSNNTAYTSPPCFRMCRFTAADGKGWTLTFMGEIRTCIIRHRPVPVKVGELTIGGSNEVIIQSMCTTKTADVEATVAEILRLEEAGCQIVRVTVNNKEAAEAIKEIKKQIHIPLVADIHFDYRLALAGY